MLHLLGFRVPPSVTALSTHQPTLEVRMEEMDALLTWAADTRLHIEFQGRVADLTRFPLYDAGRFQMERRPIRTVVVDTDLGTLILEVKGGRDPCAQEKEAGARRWVAAVNRDSGERACGRWAYRIVRRPAEVPEAVADAARELSGRSAGTVSWLG